MAISPYLKSLAKVTPPRVDDNRINDIIGSATAPDVFEASQNLASEMMTNQLMLHDNGKVLSAAENEMFASVISNYWGLDKDLVKADLPGFIERYTGIKVGNNWLQELGEYASTWADNKKLSFYQFKMNFLDPESDAYKKYQELSDNISMNIQKKQKTFKNFGKFGTSIIEAAPTTLQFLEQMGIMVASAGAGAMAGAAMGGGALVSSGGTLGAGVGSMLAGSTAVATMAGAATGTRVGHQLNLLHMDIIEAGGHAYEMRQMYNEDGTPMFTNAQIAAASIAYAVGIHLIEGYTDALVDPIVKGMGINKLSEPLKNLFDKNFATRLLGYAWDTIGQSAQEGFEGLWSSVVTDTTKDLIDILHRDNVNFDEERVKREFKEAGKSAWEDFSQSIVGFGVGGIPSALLANIAGVNRMYFNPTQVNAQMRSDANTYFDGGQPINIMALDTQGESWSREMEESMKDHKHHAIPVIINKETGLLTPINASDRAYVATLRESGATGASVIYVNRESGNENLAQYYASVIDEALVDTDVQMDEDYTPDTSLTENDENEINTSENGIIYGTSGNTILVNGSENISKVEQFFKDNERTSAIIHNEDGSVSIAVKENGRNTMLKIKALEESDTAKPEKVTPVQSYREWATLETERRVESDPFNTSNYLRNYEEKMAFDEIDKALPENDKMTFEEKRALQFSKLGAARIMPIVSEVTGINTSDLLKKFTFTFDTGRLSDMAYGGMEESNGQYKITINKKVRPDTIMHEILHGLRRLATKEQLSGFASAYGGTEGAMWVEDIKKVDGKYQVGDKTYNTYNEAFDSVRDNEERFVDDFMRYLYGEEGFTDSQKSFFAQVKEFFENFWDRMRELLAPKLSAETVRAFDILFGKDTPVQERADFIEVAATEGIRTAVDLANTGLEDIVERDMDNGLDEEGNTLWQRAGDINSEQFINWFKGSKVVNSDGSPMVVYHGTNELFEDFEHGKASNTYANSAKNGFFFTNNRRVADSYLSSRRLERIESGEIVDIPTNPRVMEVYLHMENPLEFNAKSGEKKTWNDLFDEAKKNGHDGIIIRNIIDAKTGVLSAEERQYYGEADDYIVFSNDQIRIKDSGLPENNALYQRIMDRNTQARIDADYEKVENALRADSSNFDSDGNHLAPNGKKSNLTYRQWVQVRTPAFMNWFGDWISDPKHSSMVVDENGEPKVVYHGTINEFDTFEINKIRNSQYGYGFYFADFEEIGEAYGNNVISAFLNIRKPVFARSRVSANLDKLNKVVSLMRERGYTFYDQVEDFVRVYGENGGQAQELFDEFLDLKNFLTDEDFDEEQFLVDLRDVQTEVYGTDGYIVKNYAESPHTVYVAWSPNQIKSATDNSGEFSTENDSILYQTNTDSENFKNWFKGSKVVDENGNPLRVYHGTPSPGFNEFSSENRINAGEGGLFYFTDNTDIASQFSVEFTEGSSAFRNRPTGNFGGVYPVYLSMQNPLDFRSLTEEQIKLIAKEGEGRYGGDSDYIENNIREAIKYNNDQLAKFYAIPVLEKLTQFGYDGMIARMGTGHYEGAVEYAVPNSNQIKSVFNSGKYSKNKDILYQVQQSNQTIESLAANENDIVRIDGLSYIKIDKGYDYNPDTLRNLKDSVSEELHGIDQLELDFGQSLFNQTTDSENGEKQGKSGEVRTDNRKGKTVYPRGLRPSVAQYFNFNSGWTGKEPGIAINDQWDNFGYVSFVGAQIYSVDDVAKLFSLYRNPRFEYFHIVFVKEGQIVGHTALSTGLPGRTFGIPEGDYDSVVRRMQALKADGYYLLHNHPSGNVEPSDLDINLTFWYSKRVPGFLGHLILDHDKYHVLSGVEEDPEKKRFGFRRHEEVETWGFHEIPQIAEDLQISSPGAIADYVFDKVNNDSSTWALYLDNGFRPFELEPITAIPKEEDILKALKTKRLSKVVYITTNKEYFLKVQDDYLSNAISDYSYMTDFVLLLSNDGIMKNYYSLVGDTTLGNVMTFGRDWQDDVANEIREQALIPKWDKTDSSGTLFQLSDEERKKALESRKRDIETATAGGYWVRTEYIEEFAGEDWADRELLVRHWMQENPKEYKDLRDIAREVGDFDEFKQRIIGDSEAAWTDDDTVFYKRIYQLAQTRTAQEKDSEFIARNVMGDDNLLKTAKALRGYADLDFVPKPGRRSGGYYKVVGQLNKAKGVSNKVRSLSNGERGSERSTSEEIQTARELILKNPRVYRMAYERAMLGENRASIIRGIEDKKFEVNAVRQESNDLTMDYDLDTLDDRLEAELYSMEEEQLQAERKANLNKAKQTDWKKTAAQLEKKLAQANADLEKLNTEKLSRQQAQKERDKAISERNELRKQMTELQNELSETKAERSQFKAQRDERRKRVNELRKQLVDANRKVRTLSRILDAYQRKAEAVNAKNARLEMIQTIKKTVPIGKKSFGASGNYDARYLDAFAFIQGLFGKQDRSELNERRSELISIIKNYQEQGAEPSEYQSFLDELDMVRALINASEMRTVPAMLQPYTMALHLDKGENAAPAYLNSLQMKADSRQSMWTLDELSDILNVAQKVAFDARSLKIQRDEVVRERRRGVVDKYFSQTYSDYDPFMEREDLEDLIMRTPTLQHGSLMAALYGYKIANGMIGRMSRLFDGNKEGVLYDFFTRQARKLAESELGQISRRLEAGEKKFKELGLKTSDLNKQFFFNAEGEKEKYTIFHSGSGEKLILTKGDMIGVYVYMQNEDGAEKIQSAFGNGISPEDARRIVDALSDAEKAWGDYIIEDMSSQWARIDNVYYEVFNMNLGKVQRYFPLISQNKLSKEMEDSIIMVGPDGDAVRWVNKSMTKERVHHAIYPLQLNVSKSWASNVRKQEHFMAFAEWSRDANYYLSNHGYIGEIITKKFGKEAEDSLQDFVNSINSPKMYQDEDDKRLASIVGRGASAAIVGNISVMLKQIPTMASAIGNVGIKEFFSSAIAPNVTLENFLKANNIMFEYGDKASDFIGKNSPIMRNRRFGMELVGETGGIGKSNIDNLSAKISDKLMKVTAGFTDKYVTSTLWLARYMTVFNELKEKAEKNHKAFDVDKAHEEAVFKAGQLISETQNTSVPMDMSQRMRKAKANPYMKPFYLFSSVGMNVFNMITYDIPYSFRNKDIKGIAKTVSFVLINVLATMAINGSIVKKDNEDDEEYQKRIRNQLIGQAVGLGIPGWGSMLSNAISGNTYGSSADIALISDASTVLRKAFNPSENKTGWENLGSLLESLGYVTAEGFGLPANLSRKTFNAIKNGNMFYLVNSTWGDLMGDK